VDYDGPNGQAWKDSRIKLYGWAEIGANVSTSSQSLTPAGYPIHPYRIELDQFIFRIERLPDTAQKDHVDWGFNVTNIYGLDYRYTIMKGIFSDQKSHLRFRRPDLLRRPCDISATIQTSCRKNSCA
jgi:hypothetical protein